MKHDDKAPAKSDAKKTKVPAEDREVASGAAEGGGASHKSATDKELDVAATTRTIGTVLPVPPAVPKATFYDYLANLVKSRKLDEFKIALGRVSLESISRQRDPRGYNILQRILVGFHRLQQDFQQSESPAVCFEAAKVHWHNLFCAYKILVDRGMDINTKVRVEITDSEGERRFVEFSYANIMFDTLALCNNLIQKSEDHSKKFKELESIIKFCNHWLSEVMGHPLVGGAKPRLAIPSFTTGGLPLLNSLTWMYVTRGWMLKHLEHSGYDVWLRDPEGNNVLHALMMGSQQMVVRELLAYLYNRLGARGFIELAHQYNSAEKDAFHLAVDSRNKYGGMMLVMYELRARSTLRRALSDEEFTALPKSFLATEYEKGQVEAVRDFGIAVLHGFRKLGTLAMFDAFIAELQEFKNPVLMAQIIYSSSSDATIIEKLLQKHQIDMVSSLLKAEFLMRAELARVEGAVIPESFVERLLARRDANQLVIVASDVLHIYLEAGASELFEETIRALHAVISPHHLAQAIYEKNPVNDKNLFEIACDCGDVSAIKRLFALEQSLRTTLAADGSHELLARLAPPFLQYAVDCESEEAIKCYMSSRESGQEVYNVIKHSALLKLEELCAKLSESEEREVSDGHSTKSAADSERGSPHESDRSSEISEVSSIASRVKDSRKRARSGSSVEPDSSKRGR